MIFLCAAPLLYWRVPFGLGVGLFVATLSVISVYAIVLKEKMQLHIVLRPALVFGMLTLCVGPYILHVKAGDIDTSKGSSRPVNIYEADTASGKLVRRGTSATLPDTVTSNVIDNEAANIPSYWNYAVLGGASFSGAAWKDYSHSTCGGPSYLYQYQTHERRAMIGAEEIFIKPPRFSLTIGQRLNIGSSYGTYNVLIKSSDSGAPYIPVTINVPYNSTSVLGAVYGVASWPLFSIGGGFTFGDDKTFSSHIVGRNLVPLFMAKIGTTHAALLSFNMPRAAMPYQKVAELRYEYWTDPVGLSIGMGINPFVGSPGLVGGVTHMLTSGVSYSFHGGYWDRNLWYATLGVRKEIGAPGAQSPKLPFSAW